jgi:hypothetical protein
MTTPVCAGDYNKRMHGVDTADQHIILPLHEKVTEVEQK